jgi:methionyl-tRNA synthetase
LRFYIASVITYSQDDLNFDFDGFYERINNELIANVGNFVNRALSFTQKTFSGKVPGASSEAPEVQKETQLAVQEAGELLSRNEIDKALKRILKYSNFLNQYFQASAPWANKESAGDTIYYSVNAARTLAILLEPFIPFSAEKIWDQLGLAGSVHNQAWESAAEMSIGPGHQLGKVEPIFRKIEAKEIEQWKEKLDRK